jgi:SPP1 family predicted phage head-tail adaptor
MDREVTLRNTTTAPNSNGVATATNTDTTVFAERKSVKRSEFYAAQSAGVKADIVYVVNADDYDNQMILIDGGTTYKVSRAYQIGLGRVELTCTKR